jgi:biotin synthase
MQASSLAAVSCESQSAPVRRWTVEEVLALYEMPLMDLIFRAQTVHREHFDPNAIQRSTLLSVKTGGCPRIAVIARNRPATIPKPDVSV